MAVGGILMQNGANVDTEIYNNIIINQHAWRGCITVESINQLFSDHNILNDKMSDSGDGSTITLAAWQALGLDTNSLLADPLTSIFIDPASNDYHILPGAQAIDTGTNLVNPIVSDDLDGNIRPLGAAYEIGAYEYDATTLTHIITSNTDITIYPNPFTDQLIVDGTFIDYQIKVFDEMGALVTDYTGVNPPLTIDLTTLGAGIYFISVQNTIQTDLSVYKIIKQ